MSQLPLFKVISGNPAQAVTPPPVEEPAADIVGTLFVFYSNWALSAYFVVITSLL